MSACDFFRSLEKYSVEELSRRLEGLKPGHRDRVNDIVRSFANLNGFNDICTDLMLLNNYQNIGEAFISYLISQTRRLNREEKKMIRRHPILSAHVLDAKVFENVIGKDLFQEILYHHERFDGKGFFRVQGKQVPELVRVISPMDFYVAVTSVRPHRDAVSHEEAIQELHNQSGKMFDPKIIPYVVEAIECQPEERQKFRCAK